MRRITQDGIELIKKFEGFSAEIYEDAAGYPTIGYGHLVKKGEDFSAGISAMEAEKLLAQDAFYAENAVLRMINRPLSDGQFNALVSFTFNLGSGALQASTLRRKVNSYADSEVPAEFARWRFAGGRILKGLVKRRAAEAEMYILG